MTQIKLKQPKLDHKIGNVINWGIVSGMLLGLIFGISSPLLYLLFVVMICGIGIGGLTTRITFINK